MVQLVHMHCNQIVLFHSGADVMGVSTFEQKDSGVHKLLILREIFSHLHFRETTNLIYGIYIFILNLLDNIFEYVAKR